MKEIDVKNWPRQKPYEMFRSVASPHFGMTADIDITRFVEEIKPSGISAFNAVLFAIMTAANGIPEFRTRFTGNKVYEHEVTHPSFTVPIANNQFAFCEAEFAPEWNVFNETCNLAVQRAKNQTQLTENASSDHWTYLTCTPWMHFTGVTHAHNGVNDCIPRIAWGKFSKHGEQWLMPINVQAHHALLDGFHLSRLFERTEALLAENSFK